MVTKEAQEEYEDTEWEDFFKNIYPISMIKNVHKIMKLPLFIVKKQQFTWRILSTIMYKITNTATTKMTRGTLKRET